MALRRAVFRVLHADISVFRCMSSFFPPAEAAGGSVSAAEGRCPCAEGPFPCVIRRGRQAAGTAGASLMRCISAAFRYPAGSSGKVRMRARKPCLQKADSGSVPGWMFRGACPAKVRKMRCRTHAVRGEGPLRVASSCRMLNNDFPPQNGRSGYSGRFSAFFRRAGNPPRLHAFPAGNAL